MEKFRNFLTFALSFILTIGIEAGCVALGVVVSGREISFYFENFESIDVNAGFIPLFITLLLILGVAAVNFLLFKKEVNDVEKMSAQEADSFTKKEKERIEKDYTLAERDVYKKMILNNVYYAALIVIFALFFFFLGFATLHIDIVGFVALVIIPIYWYILTPLTAFPKADMQARAEEFALNEKDYPFLLEIIQRAKKQVGCNLPVRMNLTTGGIGVLEVNGEAYISLDPVDVALLTENELFAVMLHEFAHVTHEHTKRKMRFQLHESRWDVLDLPFMKSRTFLSYAFFFYRLSLFSKSFYIYSEVSSRRREIQADAAAGGEFAQDFINATAKGKFVNLYRFENSRVMYYDFYELEEQPKDYLGRVVEGFRKKLPERENFWRELASKELPARIDSHPTLKMRMESLGCENFNCYTVETKEEYLQESKKLIERADSILYEQEKERYKENREFYYLRRNEVMEHCERRMAEGNLRDPAVLLQAANAYQEINLDKALEIVDFLLENGISSKYAAYIKGKLLAECYYSPACIPLLYEAATDGRFAENALGAIGQFALLTGNQKELEEYRAKAPAILDEANKEKENYHKDVAWDENKQLFPVNLSEDLQKEIVDGLRFFTQDTLLRIDSMMFYTPTNQPVYLLILQFPKDEDLRIRMNQATQYIDYREENFYVAPAFPPNAMSQAVLSRANRTVLYKANKQKT